MFLHPQFAAFLTAHIWQRVLLMRFFPFCYLNKTVVFFTDCCASASVNPAYGQVLPCCPHPSDHLCVPSPSQAPLLPAAPSHRPVAQEQNQWHKSNPLPPPNPPLHDTLCFCREGLFTDYCPHDEGNPSILLPRAGPGGETTLDALGSSMDSGLGH